MGIGDRKAHRRSLCRAAQDPARRPKSRCRAPRLRAMESPLSGPRRRYRLVRAHADCSRSETAASGFPETGLCGCPRGVRGRFL